LERSIFRPESDQLSFLRKKTKFSQLQSNFLNFLDNEIKDRQAPAGFEDLRNNLGKGLSSDWGKIHGLDEVLDEEELLESADEVGVTIVEPWEHVGHNSLGEEVRASVNVAYLAKAIGMNSKVVPLWKIRCGYPVLPASKLVQKLWHSFCVFEGGAPDVYDESTFHVDTASRDFLWEMYKHVLLTRHKFQVCVFICLSHQMVGSTLVELVKDAVCELSRGSEKAQALSKKIEKIGNKIKVLKKHAGDNDVAVACGFRDQKFATARNEIVEAALLSLHEFDVQQLTAHSPELQECLNVHTHYSKKNTGVYEIIAKNKRELSGEDAKFDIAMFHGVEVNWEAIVFVNWVFSEIAELRKEEDLAPWMYDLPVGVEITSCTKLDEKHVFEDGKALPAGAMVTDVASMRIDYVDKKGVRRSSYSCQFHPELTASLRDARYEKPLEFTELLQQDGQRMLVNFWKQG